MRFREIYNVPTYYIIQLTPHPGVSLGRLLYTIFSPLSPRWTYLCPISGPFEEGLLEKGLIYLLLKLYHNFLLARSNVYKKTMYSNNFNTILRLLHLKRGEGVTRKEGEGGVFNRGRAK